MKWSLVIALMLLASCRCGSRDDDAQGTPAGETTGTLVKSGGTPKESVAVDEHYDMALAVDRAIVEMLSDRLAQPDVLQNAALLYRQQHGRWPRSKDDVAGYVFNVDRYAHITYAPGADGGVVVDWELKGSHGRGRFAIPPRDAPKAATAPASSPAV